MGKIRIYPDFHLAGASCLGPLTRQYSACTIIIRQKISGQIIAGYFFIVADPGVYRGRILLRSYESGIENLVSTGTSSSALLNSIFSLTCWPLLSMVT